ncbi:MAG: hypothetical protein QMD95_02945 [Candidatus Hodarchaeaceae archaeon]|nr:hypothetical protein [Candidatus Hodarchaeaceae archaeon]
MSLELKPFVRALTQKDPKKAREWLEQNKGNFNPANEFERGYLLALQGMVSALETGGELSLIKLLVNGSYGKERIETLIRETRARLSLKFRPKDEQGFDTAWVDVLQEFSEEKT